MRDRPLYKLLLAAALVVGQWLAVAHDFQHPVTASDLACQVCAHGQPHQAGATVLPSLNVPHPGSDVPWVHPPAPLLAQRYTPASIRAPPRDLV
jgi:hypothetical protein